MQTFFESIAGMVVCFENSDFEEWCKSSVDYKCKPLLNVSKDKNF